MISIPTNNPVHLIFPFDIMWSSQLISRLFSNIEPATILIFLDRSKGPAFYKGRSYIGHIKNDKSDLKGTLFFLKGDSRYMNMGLNFNTWKTVLPQVDFIWLLEPYLFPAYSPVYINFLNIIKSIKPGKKPAILSMHILEKYMPDKLLIDMNSSFRNHQAENDSWQEFFGRQSLPVSWPDFVLDFLFSWKPGNEHRLYYSSGQKILNFFMEQLRSEKPIPQEFAVDEWYNNPTGKLKREQYFNNWQNTITHRRFRQ